MYALLAPLVLAGVVSAADRPQITLPPQLDLAVNLASPDACSTIANQGLVCLQDFGGSEEDLLTADVDELLSCACCSGSVNLASDYSACSTYLTDELPSFTSEADAYAQIYPLCAASARCSGRATSSSDDTTSAVNTRTTAETTTTEESLNPTATNSDLPELTSATESLDLPTACENMFGMFTDCVADTPGFSTLPYRSQAPCYCCSTRGNNLRYNTQIDDYASECADWAVTGDPFTYYEVASTFASFCQNFSDACDAAALTEPTDSATETDTTTEATTTEDSTTTEETGTSTDTQTQAGSDTTTSEPDAGVSLRVSAVAGLVTLFALLLVL